MNKFIAFLTTCFIAGAAHAATPGHCASKNADAANIAGLLKLINPWGTWVGTADNQTVVIDLSLPANGKYMATADFGGKKFGPLNVKVCEYADAFSLVLYGYEVEFKVLSSKKIEVMMAVGSSPSVVLKKQ